MRRAGSHSREPLSDAFVSHAGGTTADRPEPSGSARTRRAGRPTARKESQ